MSRGLCSSCFTTFGYVSEESWEIGRGSSGLAAALPFQGRARPSPWHCQGIFGRVRPRGLRAPKLQRRCASSVEENGEKNGFSEHKGSLHDKYAGDPGGMITFGSSVEPHVFRYFHGHLFACYSLEHAAPHEAWREYCSSAAGLSGIALRVSAVGLRLLAGWDRLPVPWRRLGLAVGLAWWSLERHAQAQCCTPARSGRSGCPPPGILMPLSEAQLASLHSCRSARPYTKLALCLPGELGAPR